MTNQMILKRICFPVTLKCNLRCRLCAEQSPYYPKPYHPSAERLQEQISRLFELVDYTERFDITGGEPFLRKDLGKLLKWIFPRYSAQIGKLRVTTNGSLLPPERFAEDTFCWGDRRYVIIDKYPLSGKAEAVANYMKQNRIPHELRNYSTDLHCDGWVDYGDFTLKHGKTAAAELYRRCGVTKLGFFTCMVDGRIFPCARARLLYEQGIANVCVDAFGGASISEKRDQLRRLLGEPVMEACAYCNGLCEDSPRFIPAEQLTEEC